MRDRSAPLGTTPGPVRERRGGGSDRRLRDQLRYPSCTRPSRDGMASGPPTMGLSSCRPSSERAAAGEDCQPKTREILRYSCHDALPMIVRAECDHYLKNITAR